VAGVALVCLLLAASTAGCGDVSVDNPAVPSSQRAACRALVHALPAKVDGLKQRSVSGSPYAAAWGDPAIVLRCGVGVPQGFTKFSLCQSVDGVGWFAPESAASDQSVDAVLTTVDRLPRVELQVPAKWRPPAAAMVDVARTVKDHTQVRRPCR
jgi:hypothetical protein